MQFSRSVVLQKKVYFTVSAGCHSNIWLNIFQGTVNIAYSSEGIFSIAFQFTSKFIYLFNV